jgi:hypothetical protein
LGYSGIKITEEYYSKVVQKRVDDEMDAVYKKVG